MTAAFTLVESSPAHQYPETQPLLRRRGHLRVLPPVVERVIELPAVVPEPVTVHIPPQILKPYQPVADTNYALYQEAWDASQEAWDAGGFAQEWGGHLLLSMTDIDPVMVGREAVPAVQGVEQITVELSPPYL